MQRFALPIVISITALFAGIFIGRYTVSSSAVFSPQSSSRSSSESVPTSPLNPPAVSSQGPAVTSSSAVPDGPDSTPNIIAKIKAALGRSSSRHTYATFSKLAETIDATNVREILAFVQTLPKPQDKSMLISLFVGRWAELDPQAALAYAQNLPAGSGRNWAMTSAVSGWAEHDPAAASAWAQQLPAGPMRDQATQTIVSALADKDPQTALTFLQSLPAGRNRQNLYWPIFSRWTATDPIAAAERATQMRARAASRYSLAGSRFQLGEPGTGSRLRLGEHLAAWAGPHQCVAKHFIQLGNQRSPKSGAQLFCR